MKNKGFTLIELLAVIILLAIIVAISFPIVVGVINDSKEKTYENQIKVIIKAAERWMADNPNAYDEEKRRANVDDPNDKRIRIFIDQLQEEGYINLNKQVINPKTNEPMVGCVLIEEDTVYNQFTYEYRDVTDILCQRPEEVEPFTGTIYRLNSNYLFDGLPMNGVVSVWGPSYIYYPNPENYFTTEDACAYRYGYGCVLYSLKISPGNYETDPSNLHSSHYLKHIIVDDIVTESYACFVTDTEHCLQGGGTDISTHLSPYYASSKEILQSQESYFNYGCWYDGPYSAMSDCYGDMYEILARMDGEVRVSRRNGSECLISPFGTSLCVPRYTTPESSGEASGEEW